MAKPRFISIDGKSYLWRDILEMRREQLKAYAKPEQPALFEMREDCRPRMDRTAGSRYSEPSLLSLLTG